MLEIKRDNALPLLIGREAVAVVDSGNRLFLRLFRQMRKQCHSLGMTLSQSCLDNASYWWVLGRETRAQTLRIRVNSKCIASILMLFP